MNSLVSYLLTFLGGICTGAAGTYFADKYTDQRREQEATAREQQAFESIRIQMPALISEMSADIAQDMLAREFVRLPNDRTPFSNNNPHVLIYYEEAHADLREKIQILENNGYVFDATSTNVKKYRMTEGFVRLVAACLKH